MPAFHEVLFPENISYGSAGGPKFKTTIFTSDAGYEQRNQDWANTRAEYDVSHSIKTQAQMDDLTAFFYARRGRTFGFRFKDWNDFSISLEKIAEGDGTTTSFQITKTYTSSQTESGESYGFVRKLTKIKWTTVAGVTVGGVVKTSPGDYSVDYNTGLITFVSAPDGPVFDVDGVTVLTPGAAIVIGSAEFHVPVRFDTDQLNAKHEFWNTQTWDAITLVEVRDWGEAVSS